MKDTELISRKIEAEILKLLREAETERYKPTQIIAGVIVTTAAAVAGGIIAYANLAN